MKKVLFVFVLVILLVTLVACGNVGGDKKSSPLEEALKASALKTAMSNVKIDISYNYTSSLNTETREQTVLIEGNKVKYYGVSDYDGILPIGFEKHIEFEGFYEKTGQKYSQYSFNDYYERWDKYEDAWLEYSLEHILNFYKALKAKDFLEKDGYYEMKSSGFLDYIVNSKYSEFADDASFVDYIRIKIGEGYISEFEMKTDDGDNTVSVEKWVFSDYGKVNVELPPDRTSIEKLNDTLKDILYGDILNFTLEFVTPDINLKIYRSNNDNYMLCIDDLTLMYITGEYVGPSLYVYDKENAVWYQNIGDYQENQNIIQNMLNIVDLTGLEGETKIDNCCMRFEGEDVYLYISDINSTIVNKPAVYKISPLQLMKECLRGVLNEFNTNYTLEFEVSVPGLLVEFTIQRLNFDNFRIDVNGESLICTMEDYYSYLYYFENEDEIWYKEDSTSAENLAYIRELLQTVELIFYNINMLTLSGGEIEIDEVDNSWYKFELNHEDTYLFISIYDIGTTEIEMPLYN